jgi:protein-S-isoprenylcysteine O-methyltransferase
VWIVWFVFVAGTGYAASRPSDRVDADATRISVWADVAMLVSMVGAVAAASLVPSAVVSDAAWLSLVVGTTLVALGIGLRAWAARTLGAFFTRSVLVREGHHVVRSGPYRFIRHPAYAGLLVSLIGLALTLNNWLSVVLVIAGFFVGHVPRIRAEEAALEATLGEQYIEFERGRKRLIPAVW